MIILTIRTDKPEAEIGLYDERWQLTYQTWQVHRQLAENLHQKIMQLLKRETKDWNDIQGIVAYQGPGSFTGLRIGLSVANALAYSYHLSITGATGNDWVEQGIETLLAGKGSTQVLPEYGSPVHVTQPRK
jgi:tRNA threonylcarbamoyladenosine biosynthesis protein TsaB